MGFKTATDLPRRGDSRPCRPGGGEGRRAEPVGLLVVQRRGGLRGLVGLGLGADLVPRGNEKKGKCKFEEILSVSVSQFPEKEVCKKRVQDEEAADIPHFLHENKGKQK